MTDLEISIKIAEIESIDYFESDGIISSQNFLGQCREYSPLTDDALWQSLIFKYEVSISFVFGKLLIVNNGIHKKNFTDNTSLKINALLLIIEAHNE